MIRPEDLIDYLAGAIFDLDGLKGVSSRMSTGEAYMPLRVVVLIIGNFRRKPNVGRPRGSDWTDLGDYHQRPVPGLVQQANDVREDVSAIVDGEGSIWREEVILDVATIGG